MAQYLSVYSENLKFTKRYSSKYLTRRQVQDKFIKIKISPDFIIKASIETIIVTVSPVLKIFFSIEIETRFWKTPFRIISQNLASFQGKYLWRISDLAKALSLGLTVILLMILKLMILRNFKGAHSEASRISKMEHCGKMVNRLYLRCLTGFWYTFALLWFSMNHNSWFSNLLYLNCTDSNHSYKKRENIFSWDNFLINFAFNLLYYYWFQWF